MTRDYSDVIRQIGGLTAGEPDVISNMATVACELFHGFEEFHWVGFYRNVGADTLKIGPYQGGHGCLVIPFSKGVCGAAAREGRTQVVDDVEQFPGHIACSSSTRSEIVVPIFNPNGALIGVLDIDSDLPAAFSQSDATALDQLMTNIFCKNA